MLPEIAKKRRAQMARIRQNVKRGAELLDKQMPDWAEKINGSVIAGLFDIGNPHYCVLGTLELVSTSDDEPKLVTLNGTVIERWHQQESIDHGFQLAVSDFELIGATGMRSRRERRLDGWEYLEQVWLRETAKRLSAT